MAASRARLGAVLVCLAGVAYAVPVHRQGNVLNGQDGGYFEEENVAAGATAELTGQPSFQHAFGAAFAMMIVSEIGDKTFFIAAIMAMRHSRITVFSGAIGALAVMTVLSAYVGKIATLIPPLYTHYMSSLLFLVFGLRMLYDGYGMADDEGADELEEVTQELKKTDEEVTPATSFISPILVQAFTMTFLAEWGDRSQIATIVLGARENTIGVCIGATLGHACCTCMAVIGGRMVAEKISVRTVTLVGGVTFLLFALSSIFLDDASF